MFLQQFRTAIQAPQGQPFVPPQGGQQFHPSGQAQNLGMSPGQSQPPPFSQHMQQFLPRPPQPVPSSYPQPNTSGMAPPQSTPPSHVVSLSSSYSVRS